MKNIFFNNYEFISLVNVGDSNSYSTIFSNNLFMCQLDENMTSKKLFDMHFTTPKKKDKVTISSFLSNIKLESNVDKKIDSYNPLMNDPVFIKLLKEGK